MISLAVLLGCTGAPDPADGAPVAEDSGGVDTAPADDSGATDTSPADDTAGDTAAPPPVDADGDGVPADADCDDADAHVFPGAVEACDPVDQDCDGEPLREGACGEVQDPEVVAPIFVEGGGTAGISPDLTGDGVPDLLLGLRDLHDPDGGRADGYGIYPGPVTGLPWSDGAVRTWADPGLPGRLVDAGDTDGDGSRDLVVPDSWNYRVLVLRGPFAPDPDVRWVNDTETTWTSDPVSYDGYAHELGPGGDVDGDGLADLTALMGTWGDPDPVAFHAFFGGAFDGTFVSIRGSGLASEVAIVEDVDGDGLSDVSVVDEGAARLLSGAELRGADGLDVEALSILAVAEDDTTYGSLSHALVPGPDLDGDGLPELLVSAANAEWLGYEHGAVYVFDGAARGERTAADALGSWVGDAAGTAIGGGYLAQVDLDGDGARDVVVSARRADMDHGCVVLPGRLPAPAEEAIGTGIFLFGATANPGDGADIDGDGYDDLALYDGVRETSRVLYGWAVPWGDAWWW